MSDNLMCKTCPGREDVSLCLGMECGAFSLMEYCGIPAICLEFKCWEVKRCNLVENLQGCSKLADWRRRKPGMCEFCEAICGHHWDGCPKNEKVAL